MNLFLDIFRTSKSSITESIESIVKRTTFLQNEMSLKNKDAFGIKTNLEKMYKELSKRLFDAASSRDFNTIVKITGNSSLLKKYLVDSKGHNVIEYSLFNDDDELFKYLFKNCHQSMASYFNNVPMLFTIILNRKNMDLIEFFLKNDSLSSSLNRENITNCLFTVIQINRRDLVNFIVKNFINLLDARNIEASMIYSISHNQKDELALLFSHPSLIAKFSDKSVEKMLALSIMSQNISALEIMIDNEHFINVIEGLDKNVVKNILQIAYDKRSAFIVDKLMKNDKLNNNIKEIIKIENKKV